MDVEQRVIGRDRRVPFVLPARADVGYRELAERLKKHGLKETEASIANKISRGTFSATFFLASLIAIKSNVVRLEDI